MSTINVPAVLDINRLRILTLLMALVSIVPVKNANMLTMEIVYLIVRGCNGAILFTLLSTTYDIFNLDMHKKYGIAVALSILHVFFCDFLVSGGIFVLQVTILSIKCYRTRRQRMVHLNKPMADVEELKEVVESKSEELREEDLKEQN